MLAAALGASRAARTARTRSPPTKWLGGDGLRADPLGRHDRGRDDVPRHPDRRARRSRASARRSTQFDADGKISSSRRSGRTTGSSCSSACRSSARTTGARTSTWRHSSPAPPDLGSGRPPRAAGRSRHATRSYRSTGASAHPPPSSSTSSRRPSGSAFTRPGAPRPTAPTRRQSSPGSPLTPRRSASARPSFDPGTLRRDDRDDGGDPRPSAAGRFLLGLGSSGPQVSEGWHGRRFARQLLRTREYVDVVRMALEREPVRYQGETLELPLPDGPGKPLRLMMDGAGSGSPSTSPRWARGTRRCAAEIADGWLPTLVSPEHMDAFRPALDEGFRAAPARRDRRSTSPRSSASASTTTSRPRVTRCARSSRSTSGGWARGSGTSTTGSSARTASRPRRPRSRRSTSPAAHRRPRPRCRATSSTPSRSSGRTTALAIGSRATAPRASARWSSGRWKPPLGHAASSSPTRRGSGLLTPPPPPLGWPSPPQGYGSG